MRDLGLVAGRSLGAAAVCVASLAAWAACAGGGGGGTWGWSDTGDTDAVATVGSTPTPWQESGTTALPTYASNCRPTTAATWVSDSNGGDDDSFALELAGDGSGVATLRVHDGSRQVLDATISLERAFALRSYRDGSGSVVWADGTGQAVDATLCFSRKLAAGVSTNAEFALIIRKGGDGTGAYLTIGGHFTLPGEFVLGGEEGQVVSSDSLDIDLR